MLPKTGRDMTIVEELRSYHMNSSSMWLVDCSMGTGTKTLSLVTGLTFQNAHKILNMIMSK